MPAPEKRLRCLWLTRVDPMQPDAGDLSYSFHLLASLGCAGAAVTVLTVARAGNSARRANTDRVEWVLIAPDGDAELRGRVAFGSVLSRLPNVAASYKTRAFQRELDAQLTREWDVIVVDHLGMGWVWPRVEAYRRRNYRAISMFIAHQCESDVRRSVARSFRGNPVRKLALHLDARKAGLLEREMVRKSTLFSVITAEDRRRFGNLAKSVLLTPGYAGTHVGSREITSASPRRALIFGSALWLAKQMNLIEFVAAADELFWRSRIELWVVGKVPEHLRANTDHRSTRFLGFVDDPEPIFRTVRIGIVAERTGGGFKLKSLDYIFNRLPIAAIQGSLAGLPLTPDIDYLSFASISELVQGIIAVINDVERLNALQEAAYAKCSTAFDWTERGQSLFEAMQDAAHGQNAAVSG